MPADLMRAVNHSHVILAWQENLSKDEIPPEWMWALDDQLEEWFEQVEQRRDEKLGPRDSSNDTVVPLMQNELTRNRSRRRR